MLELDVDTDPKLICVKRRRSPLNADRLAGSSRLIDAELRPLTHATEPSERSSDYPTGLAAATETVCVASRSARRLISRSIFRSMTSEPGSIGSIAMRAIGVGSL